MRTLFLSVSLYLDNFNYVASNYDTIYLFIYISVSNYLSIYHSSQCTAQIKYFSDTLYTSASIIAIPQREKSMGIRDFCQVIYYSRHNKDVFLALILNIKRGFKPLSLTSTRPGSMEIVHQANYINC